MSAGSAAVLAADAKSGDARRIGVLFMIGSALFAVASLPAASELSQQAVGVTYFIGSLFFTTAAFEQLRTARGEGAGVAAAGIQFIGTLFFNVTTFTGMSDRLTTQQSNLLVWSPDAIGSICFLVASALALIAVWGPLRPARRSASLNLVGSIFFGFSAIASYVVPDTNEVLNASIATSGTLLGAICFYWGARILIKPPPWLRRHQPA